MRVFLFCLLSSHRKKSQLAWIFHHARLGALAQLLVSGLIWWCVLELVSCEFMCYGNDWNLLLSQLHPRQRTHGSSQFKVISLLCVQPIALNTIIGPLKKYSLTVGLLNVLWEQSSFLEHVHPGLLFSYRAGQAPAKRTLISPHQ